MSDRSSVARAESIRERQVLRQGLSSLHHQPLVGPSAPRGATPLGRLRPLHLSRIASIYERQALSSQHPAPPTTERLTGRALGALQGYSRTCRNGSTNRKQDMQATSADALFAKIEAQHGWTVRQAIARPERMEELSHASTQQFHAAQKAYPTM